MGKKKGKSNQTTKKRNKRKAEKTHQFLLSDLVFVEDIVRERLEDSCDIGSLPSILSTQFESHIPKDKWNNLGKVWWYLPEEAKQEVHKHVFFLFFFGLFYFFFLFVFSFFLFS